MDKITQILENDVRRKYFEAGVHIKNPIKNSYQDGLGRTTQTLDHVVVVHILIWYKRKSQINEYSDSTERPLSAISYWIRSLHPGSFCLKQKAIYNSCMQILYIDIPVVILPIGTYPWCTLVPDQDPMEALVKRWFAVHSMKTLQMVNWSKTNLSIDTSSNTMCWSFWTFTTSAYMQGPRHICCWDFLKIN